MNKKGIGPDIDCSIVTWHDTEKDEYMSISIFTKGFFCFELKLYKKTKDELTKSTNNIITKIIQGIQ